MAKHILLSMAQDDPQSERKAGDVVSIRNEGDKVTELEKKLFVCTEVELSKAETEAFFNKLSPKANVQHPTQPIPPATSVKAEADAWCDELKAEINKTPLHGVQLNLSHIEVVGRLADLQDKKKEVPMFEIEKAAFTFKK